MMKFTSIASLLALGGVNALPKPKPKPRPAPVLANSTVQYSSTGSRSKGSLSALSLELLGDEINQHLSLSMKDRKSAIALPDTSSVGFFALDKKAADWRTYGLISGQDGDMSQRLGDTVSITGYPYIAVSEVRYNQTFVNETCVDCGTANAPACCADMWETMDIYLQVYEMSAKKKREPTLSFEWSLVTALATYGHTVSGNHLGSVDVSATDKGDKLVAGLTWKDSTTGDDEVWKGGVFVFTSSGGKKNRDT